MAFTERVEHKVEILPPYYQIGCRDATIVEKDGVEIARNYHRSLYNPGDDLSAACEDVQKAAAIYWTPDVIQTWQNSLPTPPSE